MSTFRLRHLIDKSHRAYTTAIHASIIELKNQIDQEETYPVSERGSVDVDVRRSCQRSTYEQT